MVIRFADLQCREVINICTGQRYGYVCDIEFDCHEGCIKTLIIPGPCRFFGLFGREDDYCVPWNCIERIGDDIILVSISGEIHRCKREKKRGFF